MTSRYKSSPSRYQKIGVVHAECSLEGAVHLHNPGRSVEMGQPRIMNEEKRCRNRTEWKVEKRTERKKTGGKREGRENRHREMTRNTLHVFMIREVIDEWVRLMLTC